MISVQRKVIWKFNLDMYSDAITVPSGSNVIHFDLQHGKPTIWIEVIPDNEPVTLKVVGVPTGGQIPVNSQHIKTIQYDNGSFVLHYYYVWG